MVLLAGIAGNCTAVLNSAERFALPALAPALIPLAIVAGILLLGGQPGIWALVLFTTLGTAAQAVLVAWSMGSHGYHLRFRWYGMSDATREVAHQYGPVLLSSVVASGGLLVDQAMAASLPAGSVSTLVFAGRFVGFDGEAVFLRVYGAAGAPFEFFACGALANIARAEVIGFSRGSDADGIKILSAEHFDARDDAVARSETFLDKSGLIHTEAEAIFFDGFFELVQRIKAFNACAAAADVGLHNERIADDFGSFHNL